MKRSKISGSIGKIWLRPRSIGKIWPRRYELRQNFDNYKVSQKPTGNYFLSVLSTKIKLAIDLDEVKIFEFPKENLPKKSLRQNFLREI